MSIALMAKAMNIKVGNPLRKLVLIKLADNTNDKGECWPSYQYIADQCETTRRTVIRLIKELQQQGFLRVEERKINGTLNKSNVYHLDLNGGDTVSLGGDRTTLGSVTGSLGGSVIRSPRTSHSFEPVKEPKDITPQQAVVTKSNKTKLDLSVFTEQPSENYPPVKKDDNPRRFCTHNHKGPNNNLRKTRSLKILFDPMTEKPNNVSLKCWQSWIEYKKAKKHTLTQKSWEAQREMLELHSDPETVINNSIMNGWQGLFPNKTSKSQTVIDHNQKGWYNENGY